MMLIREQDHITYLANVVCLARADGLLSAKELAAIEEIRSSIGAKKGALNASTKSAASKDYVPAKLGTFAEQVANLADMLYVCLVDGDLDYKELTLLTPFWGEIGLTKDQFKLMVEEAIIRASRTVLSITCSSCGGTVSATVKFCPNCGAPVGKAEGEAVSTELQISPTGYAIEFCESTSASFEAALDFAKTAPAFATCVRGKKRWYLASWPEGSFLQVLRLAELLTGIRNRRCYHNGAEMPWDEVFGFAWCAQRRDAAYQPVEYCFGKDEKRLNPWGCKQARMDWGEWAPWLSYGEFRRTGMLKGTYVWVFDKARIRHEIAANIHRFRFCPHLRPRLVDAVLRALPDKVEVTPDGPWKYSRAYEETPGSIKMVEVRKEDDFEFREEYFAVGVRPKGLGILEEILKKAFVEVGASDVTALQLTK
jgi:hypothetical protein